MKHCPGFLRLVGAAKSRIREIDVAAVRRRLADGDEFHLIDVREDHEWEQGRIAGAKHIGRGILERDIEHRIPDHDAEIVLYCGGGFRSALAADNLQKMGYRNVQSMDGGFTAWKKAGAPVQ
jgi:rhodanese-related sulfurtransferase